MFKWLLEQNFMPHGHCYFWRPDILWMHVISDGIIALAYFSIPVTLLYFLRRRRDVPFPAVIALFAAFILLCGTTHIFGIWTVWNPDYALDGVVKAMTALVSIFTALVMIPIVPAALRLRSPTELEAANRLLQEEIERRRDAEIKLEAAITNLYRSNEELQQFASVASHDLQSPLRGIIGFTQLLEQECKGKISKDADEYLDFITQSGTHMQVLIKDLLELSRIGREDEPPGPVHAGNAVEGALKQLRADIKEKNVQLEIGELPQVLGNESQLRQLFQNLIGNSIKYTAPDVIPEIHICASREENRWHFVIEDNGIGIPDDQLRAVFVIFRRLHTVDQFPGTGIGLALCKKNVEQHSGTIWVESTVGKGSRFHFTLPAVSTQSEE